MRIKDNNLSKNSGYTILHSTVDFFYKDGGFKQLNMLIFSLNFRAFTSIDLLDFSWIVLNY